jgi:hypothetical protein
MIVKIVIGVPPFRRTRPSPARSLFGLPRLGVASNSEQARRHLVDTYSLPGRNCCNPVGRQRNSDIDMLCAFSRAYRERRHIALMANHLRDLSSRSSSVRGLARLIPQVSMFPLRIACTDKLPRPCCRMFLV